RTFSKTTAIIVILIAPILAQENWLIQDPFSKGSRMYEKPVAMNIKYNQPLFKNEVNILPSIVPDFQVNENVGLSSADQFHPSVSMDKNGSFVITWRDERNVELDIYAQRFAGDGSALGSNFKVNDDNEISTQRHPAISADGNGNFVIAWYDNRDGKGDIYAQRFLSDGSSLGSNFKVNDDIVNAYQDYPSIAADDSGNFVITWQDSRIDSCNQDIYAQYYSSDGSALGNNFKVNDDSGPTDQWRPSAAIDGSGNFVITWGDNRNGGTDYSDIYAQRYAADGTALGNNFKINDNIVNAWLGGPSIVTDNSGNFVIAWTDERNGNRDIYAQRYYSNGTSLGNNFKINDDSGTADQVRSAICSDDSGSFVITWRDQRNGLYDIYAQRFSIDGNAVGNNFKVNDFGGSTQQDPPSIAADGSGNFIVVWLDLRNHHSGINDLKNSDIYAQRYASDGTTLGSNFKINDDVESIDQESPSIAADGSGNFVVAWLDYRNGCPDIFAQFQSSDGTALGSNFKVNDDTLGAYKLSPFITANNNGYFTITWYDNRNDAPGVYTQRYTNDGMTAGSNFRFESDGLGGNYSITLGVNGNFIITWVENYWICQNIYAQRFSGDGNSLGAKFIVGGGWYEDYPSISGDANGNFVIAWLNYRGYPYGGYYDPRVYAQRFASDGTALDSSFKVTDDTLNAGQGPPSISTDVMGNFVITWQDSRNGNGDIYAQRYANDGSAIGNNFKVNDDQGNADQWSPSISSDAIGNFVITWTDMRYEDFDIYAQRYSSEGSAVGTNFLVTNNRGWRTETDVKLWNGRIYNTWIDRRTEGTRYDIWANVLDWNNPIGISEKEKSQEPSAFILSQNYPNPFNPSTNIEISIPKTEFVTLKIYNLLGQEVATLVSDKLTPGNFKYTWDASGFASGVYYYKIQTNEYVETRKLLLIK
ncbi:T9SS type A sorting domain-containing protein, partial [Calditrichota bacterium]